MKRILLLFILLFTMLIPQAVSDKSLVYAEQTFELTDNRTVNGKLYQTDVNSYIYEGVSGGVVHYYDNGWHDIDNSWVEAPAPWDWEMTDDAYTTRVVEDITAGQMLMFEAYDEFVTFQPMQLYYTNDYSQIQSISMPQEVTPVIENKAYNILISTVSHIGSITWENAYGNGIDFRYRNTPGKLNKLLTINDLGDLPPPESWIITGGNPVMNMDFIFDPSSGLDIYVDGEQWNESSKVTTASRVEFRKNETPVWWFALPNYWDSSNTIEGQGNGNIILRKSGNSLYVSISIPYMWIENATYPVYIDPTIDLQSAASEDDAYELGNGGKAYNTNSVYMYANSATTGSGYRCAGFLIDGITIGNSDTIDVAYASVYPDAGATDSPYGQIHLNDVDDAADFSVDTDVIDRDRTTEYATWEDTNLYVGDFVNTPSIVSAVQEVVDRGGWASGQAMVFLFIGHGSNGAGEDDLSFYAYDYDDNSYGPKIHIEYTSGGGTYDIVNIPVSEALGTVNASTTYYAFGSAPSNPVQDAECTFTVNNTGTVAANVTIKCTNFTGGVGWTLTDGAPGENTVRITAYYSGQNPASGVILTTSEQDFCTVNASGSLKWDFKIETGTFTDGVEKSANITLTSYEL